MTLFNDSNRSKWEHLLEAQVEKKKLNKNPSTSMTELL